MRFIDVHCHLNGEDYGDLDALIKRLQSAEIEKVISVGFDLPSSEYSEKQIGRASCRERV